MEELNDYELVFFAKENHEECREILYQKYRPVMKKIAKKYAYLLNLKSIEEGDMQQECFIAFEEGIQAFSEQENTTFYTFIIQCIENRMITLIRKETCEKNKILNDAISIDTELENNENITLSHYLESDCTNPEYYLLEEEGYQMLLDKWLRNLSSFEECVLRLKIQNYSYKEIACILDKDEKSIDNALQRIKLKIKNST